jgi:uncharacterized membrane protein YdbT with pleckstrin-like domain
MDETPITHPGVPEEIYCTMGPKTFWIFFLRRAHATIILFFLTIALFILSQQSFLVTKQFGNIAPYVFGAAELCALAFVVVLGLTLLITWFVYSRYKYCLGDNSLKIKRGLLNKEEVSIPYRQIQDVDIKRDLSFQIMGLSRILILTAGHEDERPEGDESEGILPALDSALAEWMQAELLKRANVQKVITEPATPPSASS